MSHSKLNVLILQHEDPTPPGYLKEWLDRQNADVEIFRIDLKDSTPNPRDYDMIASLGSEFAAFDDSKPFIRREADLLRDAVEADVPVLGLCFGGQLLARTMGGHSFRSDRSEIGWINVQTREPDLIAAGPWFQWHFDTFTLPPDARLIADTEVGPQAFVIGRSLGLQFHPEVTPQIMDTWVQAYRHELDGDGVDPDALLEETNRLAPSVKKRSEQLFENFVDNIARLRRGAEHGR